MVTTSKIGDRIDIWLLTIAAEIADLPAVAAAWANESEDNRLNYALEWDELMDRFAVIADMNANRQLTAQQKDKFMAMLSSFRAALPLVKRLALYVPPCFNE